MEHGDLESRITALEEQARELKHQLSKSPSPVFNEESQRIIAEFRGEPQDFR